MILKENDNIMKNSMIMQALEYYNIKDIDYVNQCRKCLNFINEHKEILKQFTFYHNILFVDKENKLRELWNYKRVDDLFMETVHPFITNILLLSGFKYHSQNMKKRGFNSEQIMIHKTRVKETLVNDIFFRKYNGIRISQMIWGAYFINCKLIEIGSLQFEYYDEKTIKIHIPRNCLFDISFIEKSITESKEYINRYFHITDYNYYCNSWLLSKQIHKIVDESSNIYKFYELFDVVEGTNCLEDILNFVYGDMKITNYQDLSTKTSLQARIKEYLISGKEIKIGMGRLKR